MSGVMLRVFLLAATLLALAACTFEPEKQWYKPGADYTTADLQRDHAACTKNKVLDEECMKQRGWIGLSGDREPPARAAQPAGRGGSSTSPRY